MLSARSTNGCGHAVPFLTSVSVDRVADNHENRVAYPSSSLKDSCWHWRSAKIILCYNFTSLQFRSVSISKLRINNLERCGGKCQQSSSWTKVRNVCIRAIIDMLSRWHFCKGWKIQLFIMLPDLPLRNAPKWLRVIVWQVWGTIQGQKRPPNPLRGRKRRNTERSKCPRPRTTTLLPSLRISTQGSREIKKFHRTAN